MFMNNRKGRASTLSKTLLTAGLLGGAAMSTLAAGSAQAAWAPISPPLQAPSFGYSCSTGISCLNIPSPFVGDKQVTLIFSGTNEKYDIEFAYQATDSDFPWHLDTDFTSGASTSGSIVYKITGNDFSGVQLTSNRESAEENTITKQYGTGYDPQSGLITGTIDTLSLTSNISDKGPASGSILYVKDSWTANPRSVVDNINNNFRQKVPGPLPLLGAGAAFGFSRRIRRRIKSPRFVMSGSSES